MKVFKKRNAIVESPIDNEQQKVKKVQLVNQNKKKTETREIIELISTHRDVSSNAVHSFDLSFLLAW